jgi:hypothetical protein
VTKHLAQLLDDAVAGVQPRDADPVPNVVRRGQRARLRSAAMSAATVLAAFALTVWTVATNTGGTPVPDGVAAPPTPEVVGGEIVAGALRLPIPPGWQVVDAASDRPCEELGDRVIVLVGPTSAARCSPTQITVRGTPTVNPGGVVLNFGSFFEDPPVDAVVVSTPRMLALPGGEPAWVNWYGVKPSGVLLPWSKVAVDFNRDLQDERSIIDSMRSVPKPATRLVLPDAVHAVELTVPFGDEQTEYGRSTDDQTIAAVMALLDKQRSVVSNEGACSRLDHPTARLTLKTTPDASRPPRPTASYSASYASSPPEGAPSGPWPSPSEPVDYSDQPTTVIINLSADCREAVSSAGGRVLLPAPVVNRVKELLGVRPV